MQGFLGATLNINCLKCHRHCDDDLQQENKMFSSNQTKKEKNVYMRGVSELSVVEKGSNMLKGEKIMS